METLLKNVRVIKGNIMNYTQREWDRIVGIGNPPETLVNKFEKISVSNDAIIEEPIVCDTNEEIELLKKLRVIRGM